MSIPALNLPPEGADFDDGAGFDAYGNYESEGEGMPLVIEGGETGSETTSATEEAMAVVNSFAGGLSSPTFDRAMAHGPLRISSSDPTLAALLPPSAEPGVKSASARKKETSALHAVPKRARESTPTGGAPTSKTGATHTSTAKAASSATSSRAERRWATATPIAAELRVPREAASRAAEKLHASAKLQSRPSGDSVKTLTPTTVSKPSERSTKSSRSKPKKKMRSLAAAVKSLERAESSTSSKSDMSEAEPVEEAQELGASAATPMKSTSTTKKKPSGKPLTLAARKQMHVETTTAPAKTRLNRSASKPDPSASKPLPSQESDEEAMVLPRYIAVFKRKHGKGEKDEPLYLDIKSVMVKTTQLESGFLSEDGLSAILNRGTEQLKKWSAAVRNFLTASGCGGIYRSIRQGSEVEAHSAAGLTGSSGRTDNAGLRRRRGRHSISFGASRRAWSWKNGLKIERRI